MHQPVLENHGNPKEIARKIAKDQLETFGKEKLEHYLSHLSPAMVLSEETKALFKRIKDRDLRKAIEGYKEFLVLNCLEIDDNTVFLRFTSNYFLSNPR